MTRYSRDPSEMSRNVYSLILRRIAELGQTSVAESLGVSPTTISRWLGGQQGVPLDQVPQLFEVLGLFVSEDSSSTQEIVLPVKTYEALRTLAREALD